MKTREGRQAALIVRTPFLVTAVRRIWKGTGVEDTFSVLSMRSVQNVLLIDSDFSIYVTNWSAKRSIEVDNGLVAICTCRGLLKTAKYFRVDYLCSFTVAHPVQIYLGDLGSPGFYN